MNTHQIDSLLSNESKFKGSCPCDLIPDIKEQEYSVIVNTDNASKEGEHWTAIVIDHDTVYFMDSFGRNYNNKSFPKDYRQLLRELFIGKKVVYNDRVLQSFQSNACAEFCIFFIKKFYEGVPFSSIFRSFTDDLCSNDKKVVLFVKNLD